MIPDIFYERVERIYSEPRQNTHLLPRHFLGILALLPLNLCFLDIQKNFMIRSRTSFGNIFLEPGKLVQNPWYQKPTAILSIFYNLTLPTPPLRHFHLEHLR